MDFLRNKNTDLHIYMELGDTQRDKPIKIN